MMNSSKREYICLSDYANQQGAPVEEFEKRGWREVRHKGRRALEYPTATGARWRYLDGHEPRHDSPNGYKPCWYGELDAEQRVLVNGAAGVIVARYHGIAAIAVSDGEARRIPDNLLDTLKTAGVRSVIVAHDCDSAGRASAARRIRQLLDEGFDARAVDLQLGENGDIADFCKLHGNAAPDLLDDLPTIEPEPHRDTLYEPFRPSMTLDDRSGMTRDDCLRLVTEAMEREFQIKGYKSNGFSYNFVNHWRGEKTASAAYSRNSGTFYDQGAGGEQYGLYQLAERFGIPTSAPRPKRSVQARQRQREKIRPQAKTVSLPPFTADLTVNLAHISDIDLMQLTGYKAVLIKAPTGSGKTTLGKRLITAAAQRLRREPTVLVITYRTALARKIADAYGLICYKDLEGEAQSYIKSAPQLAISYDSLWRVADNTYDLVFIDEISQFHPHLEGGTMNGSEPRRAYAALKGLVQRAGTFYGFDAHNCDINVQWAQQLKGKALTLALENTHCPNKGTLMLHADISSVYTRARTLTAENTGCVVIATSSKQESEVFYRFLSDEFGAENGYLINADNSEGFDAQHVINTLDEQLQKLRFFVYSPSLGTGIDIQAPVRAVLGVFYSQPIAPSDMVQMMGRCRKAAERHAFVQTISHRQETDWHELYRIDEVNAVMTRQLSDFDVYDTPVFDDGLRAVGKLLAQYRAQRNAAMNDPYSYFVALAANDGYIIEYADGEDDGIRDLRKAIKSALSDERKALCLSSSPVSHEQLNEYRRAGTLTLDIRTGNERYKIEETIGLTINPKIYDDLRTSALRSRVRRFADMWDDLENLKTADRHEGAEGRLLSKRSHRVAVRLFMEGSIKQLFDCTLEDLPLVFKDIPGDKLERRLDGFANLYRDQLTRLLGWRPNHHSDSAIALLRWLLSKIGLKLVSHQIMRDGQRFRVYSLDTGQWETMWIYAEARLAHLAAKRAERGTITQNRLIRGNPVLSNTAKTRFEPPLTDAYPADLARSARLAAYLSAMGV